jgi:bifunctional non-homologous end joining protein LigD
MGLTQYKKKRDFERTSEPKGHKAHSPSQSLYVIQKHAASRLHYDLRLEHKGVLKSWAIPKGPSLDPAVKRLAVEVEDHPVDYGSFEGTIPKGQYGGGTVMLWDRGTWVPVGDPQKAFEQGKLKFQLKGKRLQGGWTLARMRGERNWLLIKEKDGYAKPSSDSTDPYTTSVSSGRTMEAIAEQRKNTWQSDRPPSKEAAAPPDASARRSTARQTMEPGSLTKARKAALPTTFKPQLATLVTSVPAGSEWLHEIKFDGYRILCFIRNGKSRLLTRNGLDWTRKFPSIVKAVSRLSIQEGLLDGELVVLRPDGTSDFQALQNVLKGEADGQLHYYVFDLPFCDGYDLTRTPLLQRKNALRGIFPAKMDDAFAVHYTDHIEGKGSEVYAQACRIALEGVVSKLGSSPYQQKRSRDWLKIRCMKRQEFVIGGYSEPGGAREGFGSLLLGYYTDQKELRYAGRVGTGFTEASLRDLHRQLRRLETPTRPFTVWPALSTRGVHWIKPELVGEVEFTEWTSDGMLRHPSFKGLREDKRPTDVSREMPATLPATAKASHRQATPKPHPRGKPVAAANSRAREALSNPDRILYPDQGITKQALADYYTSVASWILPYVVNRPLTIVRCPEGHQKSCFYQKHVTDGLPKAIRSVQVKEKHGVMKTLVIDDLDGLLGLVQIGVLEIHLWGSSADQIDKPDRLVFDLDPAPDVDWKDTIQAAQLLQKLLETLHLTSFVKTTGGKGLHVVAPLDPIATWDEVKPFAKSIAAGLTRHAPNQYIDVMTKAKRTGKIFIDYLRNGYGATSIAPYSTRATSQAPVSTPIRWDELTVNLNPAALQVKTVPARLKRLRRDPWGGFVDVHQAITPDLQRECDRLLK